MTKFAPHHSNEILNRTLVALSIATLFSAQAYAQDFEFKDKIFEDMLENNYAFNWKYKSINDLNQINIDNIEFKNMGDFNPDQEGNGGLRLVTSDITGTPTSQIRITNIRQTGKYDWLKAYWGIRSESSSLKVNQIYIDTITAEAKDIAVNGFFSNGDLTYGTITISNLTAKEGSAQGLDASSIHAFDGIDGAIRIDNINGSNALGARIGQNASGSLICIKNVTSTADYDGGYTRPLVKGLEVDQGKFDFDTVLISQIHSKSGNGLGLTVDYRNDFSNKVLFVNSVSGVQSFGVQFGADIHAEHPVNTETVTIQKIGSETSDKSLAIDLTNRIWNGKTIDIDKVIASENGLATGIVAYTEKRNSGNFSLITQDSIGISEISGGDVYGIHHSTRKNDTYENAKSSIKSKQITINKLVGKNSAYGMFNEGNALLKVDTLSIKNIKADFAVALNAENNSNAEIGSATINPSNWTEYAGGYAEDPSTVESNLKSFAVRAVSGAKVLIANTSGQTADIFGTIVAGRGTTDENAMGASIVIGNNDNTVNIVGDVYAGNGGVIEITLGKDSVMEGQVDDYHEVDTLGSDTIFRNSAFVTADGTELPVTQSGSATINLNGGSWFARGQNFVKNVAFGTDGGHIDLTKNANSSVTIENISGKGQFDMSLGAYTEGTEEIKSDMLYLKNVAKDSSFTIAAHLAEGVTVNDLAGLRFATVGSVADGHSPDLFKFVQIKDQGFNDWNLKVATEDYVSGDEDNARFNGETNGQETYKPGEDAVDAMFGDQSTASARATPADAKNYFIESIEEGTNEDGGEPQEPEKPGEPVNPGSSISDAGQAVIATARSLYYNAVDIDRFNQRYGDRRYDDSNNSIWMRVRQDRWNTDAGVGDFESRNTTYQVGYDYTQPVASGKMIYGAAFDFMNGDTDYDSIVGSGETKRYAVSAYATYVGDNGAYLDMIGKVGRLSNEYSVRLDSGAGISADYMNWMTGLSIEAGHQFSSGDSHWFIEPQVQAQYVHVSSNDYTNGQTKIDQDSIHSFITRAGVRVGRWLDEEMNANVYAKVDVLHEWAGDQDIHVKDKTTAVNGDLFEITNDGTWFDVGLGFQAPMAKSVYAYGDVEYRFGNELDQTWTFNLGAKYVF